MTAAVITAALFFVISLQEHGKGLTSMPRQYKQIHFVLGQISVMNFEIKIIW